MPFRKKIVFDFSRLALADAEFLGMMELLIVNGVTKFNDDDALRFAAVIRVVLVNKRTDLLGGTDDELFLEFWTQKKAWNALMSGSR